MNNIYVWFENKLRNGKWKLLVYFYIAMMCDSVILFVLMPSILNYPPNYSEIAAKGSISYVMQFIIILAFIFIIYTLYVFYNFRIMEKWEQTLEQNNHIDEKEISEIRNKCFNTPYILFLMQILIPTVILMISFKIISVPMGVIATLKQLILCFSCVAFAATFLLPISNSVFSKILTLSYKEKKSSNYFIISNEKYKNIKKLSGIKNIFGKVMLIVNKNAKFKKLFDIITFQAFQNMKITISRKNNFHILPMLLVVILIMSLIGYSRLIDEKGDYLFEAYKSKLNEKFKVTESVKNKDEIIKLLNEIKLLSPNDTKFIVDKNKDIDVFDNSNLSESFQNQMFNYSDRYQGHVFDITKETQGAAIRVKYSDGDYWIVGVKYNVVSLNLTLFFLIGAILLLITNYFSIKAFSKSTSKEITSVTENLSKMAETMLDKDSLELESNLPIISNDEIGDLTKELNQIQKYQRHYRGGLIFSNLGKVVGAIVHNVKTKLCDSQQHLQNMDTNINRFKKTAIDQNASEEYIQKYDKLYSQLHWALEAMEKVIDYTEAINIRVSQLDVKSLEDVAKSESEVKIEEIITIIKRRANYFSSQQYMIEGFKFNITYSDTNSNKDIRITSETRIKVPKQTLINAILECVQNSIEEYIHEQKERKSELKKIIDIDISSDFDNIIFKIRDYGRGIRESLKKDLLYQIETSKAGSKRRGMGLFFTKLEVMAFLRGDIRFESPYEGIGTCFFITIPRSKIILDENS